MQYNLNQAIEMDEELAKFCGSQSPPLPFDYLPNAYQMRAELHKNLGKEAKRLNNLDSARLMSEQKLVCWTAHVLPGVTSSATYGHGGIPILATNYSAQTSTRD